MAINTRERNLNSQGDLANRSFDGEYDVHVVEPLTLNPVTGNLERTTTIQGNGSLVISNTDEVVASTKTITKTIGATSYTKTLSYNAAGDVIAVSAWS